MMKSTGIVRKVDELGRIVIPRELRRTLDINEKDPLEIFMEDDRIILQKYHVNAASFLSGDISDDNLFLANGKLVLSPAEAEQVMKEIQSRLQ